MRKSIKIVSLVLALTMACTTLTACGGSKDKPKADAPAKVNSQADTLTFGQGAEPRGLDPALVDDGESSKVIVNIYEGLLKFEKDSTKVAPCLAKSWDISPDGLTYTFKLQEGVKFHDGTDFNAEAVKFNIDRQLPPKVIEDMGYASFVFGSVASVDVVDQYTVKVNMKEVCTPFLNNLAMSLGAPMVSPAALEKNKNNVNQAPCGTGPYVFKAWNKDQDIVLTKNDNYWNKAAAPKVGTVVFKFIKENATRVVSLTNGEIDMVDGLDATVIDQIKGAKMEINKAEGMNINYMAYNTKSEMFKTAEARKAVSMAINVPELVKGLYRGYATEATSILPTFMPGYSAEVKQVQYDEAAAKAALAKAGITKVHMITYTNPRPYNTANGQALAEAVQSYLSKVGVECVIDPYDWTTYKEKVKAGDYDICFYGWTGDNGDPDNFLNLLSADDPTMNVARYENPAFNALVKKGVVTPEGPEREKLYVQMEKMVADEAVWLPISHMNLLSAYNPTIQDYYYHVTGNIFFQGMGKAAVAK